MKNNDYLLYIKSFYAKRRHYYAPKTALSADLDEYIKMYHTENQSKDSIYSSELHVCKYGN